MTAKRFFKFLLPALMCLLLGACGFHLRGSLDFPFSSIYLGVDPYSNFAIALKREISYGGKTQVVDRPEDAEVRMQVVAQAKEKDILSLNAQGTVSLYRLRQRFSFRLVDKTGHEITSLSDIVINRDVSFRDAAALAKEQEETLLYEEMEADLIQQLMRRLAATHMPAAASH